MDVVQIHELNITSRIIFYKNKTKTLNISIIHTSLSYQSKKVYRYKPFFKPINASTDPTYKKIKCSSTQFNLVATDLHTPLPLLLVGLPWTLGRTYSPLSWPSCLSHQGLLQNQSNNACFKLKFFSFSFFFKEMKVSILCFLIFIIDAKSSPKRHNTNIYQKLKVK